MWLALMVFLGIGATVLRLIPPPGTGAASVESTFWRSTTWRERRSLQSLLRELPHGTSSIGSLELRHVVSTSRVAPLVVDRIRVVTRGPRDVCLVELVDGRVIRLTVFDDRSAQDFVSAWDDDPTAGVCLRWIESVGWQCSLRREQRHTPAGCGAVASVYGWLVDVDRAAVTTMR